jgi:hypothetical protein
MMWLGFEAVLRNLLCWMSLVFLIVYGVGVLLSFSLQHRERRNR